MKDKNIYELIMYIIGNENIHIGTNLVIVLKLELINNDGIRANTLHTVRALVTGSVLNSILNKNALSVKSAISDGIDGRSGSCFMDSISSTNLLFRLVV